MGGFYFRSKKCITEEKMILLDEQERFISLMYDKFFKAIFKENLELLKLFILDQLEFDVETEECKVELFDSVIIKYIREGLNDSILLFFFENY